MKTKEVSLELFLVVRLMGQIKSYVTHNLQYTHVFFPAKKWGGDIFAPVRSVKNGEVCVLKLTPRGDATDWFENPSRTRRTTATSEELPHTTEGWRVGQP